MNQDLKNAMNCEVCYHYNNGCIVACGPTTRSKNRQVLLKEVVDLAVRNDLTIAMNSTDIILYSSSVSISFKSLTETYFYLKYIHDVRDYANKHDIDYNVLLAFVRGFLRELMDGTIKESHKAPEVPELNEILNKFKS